MGWEDRPYYRDRTPGPTNPLQWLANGSVGLGRWFGIDVRIHATFIVYVVITLLLPGSIGGMKNAATSSAVLFGIVLFHEFGHCFASRLVGGNPSHILMHPLGGLAFADCPRRPLPTFITVAGGPLVNVLICVVAACWLAVVAGTWRIVPWRPLDLNLRILVWQSQVAYYVWWVFLVSYALLLFNLLPIFPLDGGQMLQSILWKKFGYFKATYFATITGMIGAVLVAAYGLLHFSVLLVVLAIVGFQTCLHLYRELKANGPWAYQDEDSNFAASLVTNEPAQRKRKVRAAKQAEKLEREAATEQDQIDQILAKVSAQGMNSLTWLEKRALHKATERQRARDADLTKARRKQF